MAHAPFSLQDSLIAYGDDRRAARIARQMAERGDAAAKCLIGIVEFSGDASVHADFWEYHPTGDEVLLCA